MGNGDHVVMFYESANREGAVLGVAEQFDVARVPKPHVGLGGGGSHYCLGANLARTQLRVLFSRLAVRAAGLHAGEPSSLISTFINGIKRMPVEIFSGGRP